MFDDWKLTGSQCSPLSLNAAWVWSHVKLGGTAGVSLTRSEVMMCWRGLWRARPRGGSAAEYDSRTWPFMNPVQCCFCCCRCSCLCSCCCRWRRAFAYNTYSFSSHWALGPRAITRQQFYIEFSDLLLQYRLHGQPMRHNREITNNEEWCITGASKTPTVWHSRGIKTHKQWGKTRGSNAPKWSRAGESKTTTMR